MQTAQKSRLGRVKQRLGANVTIRQLEAFVMVAECESFTRAADRLNAAQPALSILIRDLESGLGVRLLDRTTRRVELTDAGREFKIASQKILDDVDVAARNAGELANHKRGRIVVAASPLLSCALMPAVIAEMREKYPSVSLGLIDAGTDVIRQKVLSGEAVCGIGTFPEDENALQRIKVLRDNLVLYCLASSPLARLETVTWRDIAAYDIVTLNRESGLRLIMDMGFEAAGTRVRPAFEVTQSMTALSFVEAGLGIAVLPGSAAVQIKGTKVITKSLGKPIMQREIAVIRAADRAPPPAFEILLPILVKHLRRHSRRGK
jgi:DNA-binding transcriptional LysR family regulator